MKGTDSLFDAVNVRVSNQLLKLGRALSLSRYRSLQGQHSVARQVFEMLALKLLRGLGPEYYHTAGFWHRAVPWSDKLDHLGAKDYSRFIARYNSPNFQKVSQHKVVEKSMLSLFSIPTPKFIGFFHPVSGLVADGCPLKSIEDLATLLVSVSNDKICFKRPEGWGGRYFQAVELIRSEGDLRIRALNREEGLSVEAYSTDLLRYPQDCSWLIEEYCEQHPWYKSLHPSSLNTMRLWVMKPTKTEHGQVIAGYLRMGQHGSLVDNRQAGGLVAKIKVEDGGVLSSVVDGLGGEFSSVCHPETGVRVEDELLPYWAEAKELAVKALNVFPNMRFAGVDVAVAPDGPVIIELNVKPSMMGAAITGMPLRRMQF